MFNKLSYRTKIIIFAICAVIGIGIMISAAINNRSNKSLQVKPPAGTEETGISAKDPKKNEEQVKQMQEEKDAAAKAEEQKKADEQKAAEEAQKKKLEEQYQKGYAAFNNRSYWEAANLEDEVIKQDPKFYKAFNMKGIALCYSGKYDDGMAAIDKALELKPDYGYGRFNKALAYELFAHYDEALAWYDKALEVEQFVWSYYGKASIYGRRGDVANTVKYLKTAIDMEANVKEEARKEADFNPVRNSKEFQALVQ